MKFTQYIKWINMETTATDYDRPFWYMINIMKHDLFKRTGVVATWLEDKNREQLAYFDKYIQLIKGDKELKKETKEKVLEEINKRVWCTKDNIKEVLNSLEEQGYIKFKKEPKTYKVFVKIITIGGENKKLYYITDFHLTDDIDEAKRFEIDEEKDGYAYELVKEY